MDLSPEIFQAAQALGQSLKNHPCVVIYLDAKAAAESDPDAVDLEQRLKESFLAFSAREAPGDPLPLRGPDDYFALRSKVRYHPLISARENQLMVVKDVFTQTGTEMNHILGLDYAGMLNESK